MYALMAQLLSCEKVLSNNRNTEHYTKYKINQTFSCLFSNDDNCSPLATPC